MTESIGKRLTLLALDRGLAFRPCECPAHITGKCGATDMMQCGCHRHIGGDCAGVIPLTVCSRCDGPLIPGCIILACGCIECEPCGVDTLLSKPWAKGLAAEDLMEYLEPRDAHQRYRLETLILTLRGD